MRFQIGVSSTVACVLVVVAVAGCGPAGPGTGRTPAERFRDDQGNTVTPHGRIVSGSVADKDGQIEYKTEDGQAWRVEAAERSDGTPRYGTPVKVK